MPTNGGYLHYLTTENRLPRELETPKEIKITVREDSEFLTENFPDGIPNAIHKNEISIKDAKIVSLHAAGYKRSEIAELVGVTEADVTIVLKHPSSKKVLEELTQKLLKETVTTVKSRYIAHANEAFESTLKLMRHSKNDRVKLEAARDISKAAGLFDDSASAERTPIDPESAKIISDTMRELAAETREYSPLSNSEDLETIRAELEAAEEVEAIIEDTKHG